MKKYFYLLALVFLSSCSTMAQKSTKTVQKANNTKKPNIIFIMSDDHTKQAFGIYGSRLANLNPSPALDKLANEGMIFDQAFCQNSICTPSRAAILTGQHSQANGVLDLNGNLPKEKQYLPTEMKKLGYQTAIVSKWHLKSEPAAFDYYAVLDGQGKYFKPPFKVKGSGSSSNWNENVVKTVGHSSDEVMNLSLDWLKNKRTTDKPYMLLCHFKAPHEGFQFAPRYADYLKDVHIPEPENLFEKGNHGSMGTKGSNNELVNVIGSSISQRNIVRDIGMTMKIDQNLEDPEYANQTYQSYLKAYLRCVKGVDDNVKRLVDYLKETGQYDNTIIVYTSDQGFMLGEHDLIDKRWMYEESIGMPFFIRYPEKVKSHVRSNAIINNTDFAPTLIEMTGGTTPDYMQGSSFTSILETGKEPENWQQGTYYRYWMHMAHRHGVPAHFGLRTKNYKLIFYYGKFWKNPDMDASNSKPMVAAMYADTPPSWELYDFKNDPKEMNNLYGDDDYKDIISKLKVALKKQRKTLNETDKDFPHLQKIVDEYWDYDAADVKRAKEISGNVLKEYQDNFWPAYKKITDDKLEAKRNKSKNKNKKSKN